ncbi:MAG: ATP-binding protein [Planctomycetota bacterium]
MNVEVHEYGAGPEHPRGAGGAGRGLLVLVAPPGDDDEFDSCVVADLLIDAELVRRVVRRPGAPAPLLPPIPRRKAEEVAAALEKRGIATRVFPADAWARLTLRCETTPEAIEEARAAALEFVLRGGLWEAERNEIEAVLRETLANASLHGNRGEASRHIEMDILIEGPALRIVVVDEGEGFDHAAALPEGASEGGESGGMTALARAQERFERGQRGGLGLLLVSRWADRVEWGDSGRRVIVRKTRGNA